MKRWTEADLANLAMKRTGYCRRMDIPLPDVKSTYTEANGVWQVSVKDNPMAATPTTRRIYIGIDTGVNTGFAVYWPDIKQLQTVETIKIHKAMKIVETNYVLYGTDMFVRIEDARKRKWIPESRGREVLQGAGSIKRDASVWEDFLTDLGVRFEMVAPKANKTKMTAPAFKQLTGWEKVCSNHARDAAMLVFGI